MTNTSISHSDRLVKAALAYASRFNWRVLPVHGIRDGKCTCDNPACKSPSKHPRIQAWQQNATTDLATITDWWQRWPDANIGIATGAASGFWVLDVDGEAGEAALQDLEAEYGKLPDTVVQHTGGGGRHILFQHPGWPISTRGRLPPKIDVRGDGHFIVVAPSLHYSGQKYIWEASSRPDEVPLADTPEQIINLVKAGNGKVIPAEWERDIPAGERNATLARLTGSLLAKNNIPTAQVVEMVWAINLQNSKPPLKRKEVEKIVKSIAQTHARKKNEPKEEHKPKKASQADKLITIATTNAVLFHDDIKSEFASILINGHTETWPLRSKFFKQWLVRQFYEQTGKSPSSEILRQALNVIESKAVFDGPEIKLSLRVAERKGALWYDLANFAWQAVKITAEGWEVVDSPPILFRRFKNTAAQVVPKHGGELNLLKKYINLQDKDDWLLLYALIVYTFIPEVPHGIPIFYGDKGSAKTTAQRVLRRLIDPAHRDTMTLPEDKTELALMLTTNYAPCFDNLDGLSAWQSDMLSQAATGGGISKRELYTDMDEVILTFLHCPMLNGINLVASRDDLLDRSILFELDRITKKKRKTEHAFWQEFEQDRPYILGAILTALSGALQRYPTVTLSALPRMADFAQWGYAITEAMGGSGNEFMEAYYKNIAGAVEEAIKGDVVGAAIIEFMRDRIAWEGTATELLRELEGLSSVNTKEKIWPKRPETLGRRINRIRTALTDYGINTEIGRTGEKRLIILSNTRKKGVSMVEFIDTSDILG
ncbi:MAG: hypothetical protein DDT19_02739 [Syntrophomonadaceae bacterium]|nr:hypothetical protein [Bacillota bacterium]